MSTSKLITKETLTAFERWELPNVGEPGGAKAKEAELDAKALKEMLSAEKIEALRKAAYREGFEQGHREGLVSGQKEIAARVQRLQQIASALAEPLREMDARVEEELVALAIAMARQLVRRELKTDPGQIVAAAREALAALPSNATHVQLYLHPEDAALVREKILLPESGEPSWRLVEDPSLTRGGCRLTSDSSRIDATVERRLAAVIAKTLGGEREDDAASS